MTIKYTFHYDNFYLKNPMFHVSFVLLITQRDLLKRMALPIITHS